MNQTQMEELAMNGGPKAKTGPFGSGRRFGEEEKRLLSEAIDSDVLFYVFGEKVKQMEEDFRKMYGMGFCAGCSSGTAAVHIAVGALGLAPGSEVITSSVTDMGTLTGLLYQNLIPRFADVDPVTYNMAPDSVEDLVGPRTKAIVVVHHAGLASDMDPILATARKADIPVIEDCAQAFLTTYKGRLCGTMGDVSAFSLNHFKHITCGSGGMVMTDRTDLEEGIKLFVDKCYFRDGRKRNPYFLAPNYQMTELQGAVAVAQIAKLEAIISRRVALGNRLRMGLEAIDGIVPQRPPEGCVHTHFLLVVRIDRSKVAADPAMFGRALDAEGIPNEPNKITGGMPIYMYDVLKNRSVFPGGPFPFVSKDLRTNVEYRQGDCPEAEKAFEETFNLNINEFYTDQDIDEMIRGVAKVADHYRARR